MRRENGRYKYETNNERIQFLENDILFTEIENAYNVLDKYKFNKTIIETDIGKRFIELTMGYGINGLSKMIEEFNKHTNENVNKIINIKKYEDDFKQVLLIESEIINNPKLLLKDDVKALITNTLSDTNKIKMLSTLKKYINIVEGKIPDMKILNKSISNGFYFKVLETLDPDALDKVGRETECCQRLGCEGGNAAIDSFINKYSSVLVLYNKDNKLISQSYFHYVTKEQDNDGPGIILDNVEYNKKLALLVNLDAIYLELSSKIKTENPEIKYFRCGLGWNKLNANYWKSASSNSDNRVYSEHIKDPYSDYDNEKFLDLFNPIK